ncbi:MAG: DUF4317 family protein, partial [Hungatella sp.]
LEESKDLPEPLTLSKTDVKRVLEESGVSDEKLELFDHNYETTAGDQTSLLAANITNTRTFHIETPDVEIKVKPECANLVESRIIDGRQCLVIAINDHIEVNGISLSTNGEFA